MPHNRSAPDTTENTEMPHFPQLRLPEQHHNYDNVHPHMPHSSDNFEGSVVVLDHNQTVSGSHHATVNDFN